MQLMVNVINNTICGVWSKKWLYAQDMKFKTIKVVDKPSEKMYKTNASAVRGDTFCF